MQAHNVMEKKKSLNNFWLMAPIVEKIDYFYVSNDLYIDKISFQSKLLKTSVLERLTIDDAGLLYDFYYRGLSEKSRVFFPPYPLFHSFTENADTLKERISAWMNEKSWVFFTLKNANSIVGVSMLKHIHTDRPVTGVAVAENVHSLGVGFFLQLAVIEQAKLLGLEKIYATLAPDNMGSYNLHKKCGFMDTGRTVPHYTSRKEEKIVDRYDLEMMLLLKKEG